MHRNYAYFVIVLILSLFALNACSHWSTAQHNFNQHYRVPVGSKLQLHQPLRFESERRNLFIHEGKTISFAALNRYDPHCEFELRDTHAQPITVVPDQFEVYKVKFLADETVVTLPTRLASRILLTEDNLPSRIHYGTYLYLRSAKQPGVFLLTCGHIEDPALANYLTIDQIKAELGTLFSLALKHQ